jgi:hypothetical protein
MRNIRSQAAQLEEERCDAKTAMKKRNAGAEGCLGRNNEKERKRRKGYEHTHENEEEKEQEKSHHGKLLGEGSVAHCH